MQDVSWTDSSTMVIIESVGSNSCPLAITPMNTANDASMMFKYLMMIGLISLKKCLSKLLTLNSKLRLFSFCKESNT